MVSHKYNALFFGPPRVRAVVTNINIISRKLTWHSAFSCVGANSMVEKISSH
jgi:hypothetical protein